MMTAFCLCFAGGMNRALHVERQASEGSETKEQPLASPVLSKLMQLLRGKFSALSMSSKALIFELLNSIFPIQILICVVPGQRAVVPCILFIFILDHMQLGVVILTCL